MKLLALVLTVLLVISMPSVAVFALALVAGTLAWILTQPVLLAFALAVTLAHIVTGGGITARLKGAIR